MRPSRRLWQALVLGLAAAMALAGCGGSDDAGPAPSHTSAAPSATPTQTSAPVWPLTGLPAPGGVADRPALVVKVDNTAGAVPQVGLHAADLVVEELVEGGLTRLAAMYQSGLPTVVGPVRSVRTTDIGIVAPTGGALAASGGASRVLAAMDDAGLTVLTEGGAGFSRAGDRDAPYNVMLDPSAALTGLSGLSAPVQPYLPFGEPAGDTAADGDPATTVDVSFSGVATTHWTWADGTWRQGDDKAAPGQEFAPTSLVILRVTTRDAGYEDPGGNPVPETVLEGSGEVTLLTGGVVVPARWSKDAPAAAIVLTDRAGEPLTVPAGRTWIGLVPEAGSVVLP
ncbi:MAG TPA: DUF3048 domain-containing protein [Jiangellaceae bacterium]